MNQRHERAPESGGVGIASPDAQPVFQDRLSEAAQVLSEGRVVKGMLPDSHSEHLLDTIESAFGIHTPSRRDENVDIIEATVQLGSGTQVTRIHILADASAVVRHGELRDDDSFLETSDPVALESIHDVSKQEVDGETVVVANVQPRFLLPSTLTLHQDGRFFINPN